MDARRNEIAALRLSLASPQQIRSWSSGEVTRPDTINYLTQKPEPDGLFCERIFGPEKDWTCACSKYKHERIPDFVCERCGVLVGPRTLRRERMGHIELVAPIAHPWCAKATPSIIALLLGLSRRQVNAVLSYSCSIVTSLDESSRHSLLRETKMRTWGGDDTPEDTALSELFQGLAVGSLLDEHEVRALSFRYARAFQAETGAIALRTMLRALDLEALSAELRALVQASETPLKKVLKRLHVVEAFRLSGVNPAWMIIEVLPVLPPELRPLVPLSGGQFIASDLNVFYERILHRNERIKKFLAHGAPAIMLNQEKRLLQDACDGLFDNARRTHPVLGANKQALKSLTDTLKGKYGRLRRNLLGKRVDYSGRSVIVGDVSLKLHQCGLPTKICLELFKPFLIRKLVEQGSAPNAHVAKRMVERTRKRNPVIWDALEEIMSGKVVLLNRAPTLHRLSIQAFEIVWMSDSNAIRLHPCVCSAFNADFDGDQMAVHLPVSDAAQLEAKTLLLSTHNLRSPANGEPAVSITQEMVLGLFYLTQERPSAKSPCRMFSDVNDVLSALDHGIIHIHTKVCVRLPDPSIFPAPGQGEPAAPKGRIETTAGRIVLNAVLPTTLRFKNYEFTKERIKHLLVECMEECSDAETARLVDALKELGFKHATKSGISFAMGDCSIPREKAAILAAADAEVEEVEEQLAAGMITAQERYQHLLRIWPKATDEVSALVEKLLDPQGSLTTIIKSGATKAKFQQIRQLSGMRGLMTNSAGKIIEIPIRSNYKEGMTPRDAQLAGNAARYGFGMRSRNTRVTGELTRKFVEMGMEVWVTMQDCGTTESLVLTRQGPSSLQSCLTGRVLAEACGDIEAGVLLTKQDALHISNSPTQTVLVRSVLTCQAPYGVCRNCYGADLATRRLVRLGSAVGIIAGQSLGEPGTQLSMRAFHSGGIANAQGDIRAGLPRVIELFEGRTPDHPAPLAPHEGIVHVTHENGKGHTTLSLVAPNASDPVWSVLVPHGQQVLVHDGEEVAMGAQLAYGACDPKTLLATRGRMGLARYIIDEVQQVFQATGVFLGEKHLECIVRQMLRYVLVRDVGDGDLLPGMVLDRFSFLSTNAAILSQGGVPAMATPLVLGLTRASLQTKSWLAAASFRETSRVLLNAAMRGQYDFLSGFKEKILLGKRIPALGETFLG